MKSIYHGSGSIAQRRRCDHSPILVRTRIQVGAASLIVLFGSIFCQIVFAASSSVSDLLARIESAPERLNYVGSFVYEYGGKMETIRIVHRANSGEFGERLFSLTGPEREIIRTRESVWCYLPDQQFGIHEFRQLSGSVFSRIRSKQFNGLSETYRFILGRLDRVADRSARRLTVKPRDDYRYGYELWIDEQSGLLLRSDLLDKSGEVIERYMFVDLEIGRQIQDFELSPRYPRDDFVWYGIGEGDKAETLATNMAWRAAKLPKGFQLSVSLNRISPMDNAEMEQLVFSDGLASVSMFVKAESSSNSLRGETQMGGISVYSLKLGDYVVTTLGEVPMATVEMIAKNAKLIN